MWVVLEHSIVGTRTFTFDSKEEAEKWVDDQGDWGLYYEIREGKKGYTWPAILGRIRLLY